MENEHDITLPGDDAHRTSLFAGTGLAYLEGCVQVLVDVIAAAEKDSHPAPELHQGLVCVRTIMSDAGKAKKPQTESESDDVPTALIILDQGKPQSVLRCLVSLVLNYRYGLRTV